MKKVMAYLPNGIIMIGYLGSSKYAGLTLLKECSIMGQNKTHSADMSEVIEKGEGGIERLEPLHEEVYINSLFLNLHYMPDDAVINPVGKTHDRVVIGLDRRFLFQCDSVDTSQEGYITMNGNIKKIDKYTGGKGIGLGTYETSNHGHKGTFHVMNLLFISGLK